jgi:hypothetical protein
MWLELKSVYSSLTTIKDILVWNGDPPEFITPFVISDVTLLSN